MHHTDHADSSRLGGIRSSLTCTRFLQHSQTGTASFKNIVKESNIRITLAAQVKGTGQIQEVQHATMCAGTSTSPTGV